MQSRKYISLDLLVICFIYMIVQCSSYPGYLEDLPTRKVPVKCEGYTFYSKLIGHEGTCTKQTGEQNQFGWDYLSVNGNWTELCPMDSDSDNRTNGQELGDPNCEWRVCDGSVGCVDFTTTAVSHPGIFENVTVHSNGSETIFIDIDHPDYSFICVDEEYCTENEIFFSLGK